MIPQDHFDLRNVKCWQPNTLYPHGTKVAALTDQVVMIMLDANSELIEPTWAVAGGIVNETQKFG
jgi:hypothetical protein